tara:strand:- start:264 stop:707 length:444 start_codon:yes stop_codon:yes gene_type:complete
MENDKKKRSFFGNLWRSVVKNNIPLGDTIVSAIDGGNASEVIKAISKDRKMSPEQKEIIIEGINKDIEQERELTKRWESDNKSQDWLPRNIRPLVVANFTLLIDVVILSSMWGKPLGEAYLPILMTMGVTVIGGYFTLREYGKKNGS